MVTFSIWHWLIVVLFVFFVFVLPAKAVQTENSEIRLPRIGFLKWIGIFYGVIFLFGAVGNSLGLPEPAVIGISYLYAFSLIYTFFQRIARRTRDAGWDKWVAYLTIVPIVGHFVMLVLLFKPSASSEAAVNIPEKTQE